MKTISDRDYAILMKCLPIVLDQVRTSVRKRNESKRLLALILRKQLKNEKTKNKN